MTRFVSTKIVRFGGHLT